MKKTTLCLVLLLINAAACGRTPDAIPTGEWNYRLLVNGSDIGHAVISSTVAGDRYVSAMEMEMDAGYVRNTTRQVITETLDFKPVKLEVNTASTVDGVTTEMKTIASFIGDRIDLDIDGKKTAVTATRPFVLEGNYFMNELIKSGFRNGTVVRHHVYEPSVDIEEPVLIIVKVIGWERVELRGKKKKLLHIGYSIENLKNIDVYIDDRGITLKTVITMLNNRLELVKE